MTAVFLVIHVILAVSMIVLVLLQRSDGGALGGLGGGASFGGVMSGQETSDEGLVTEPGRQVEDRLARGIDDQQRAAVLAGLAAVLLEEEDRRTAAGAARLEAELVRIEGALAAHRGR